METILKGRECVKRGLQGVHRAGLAEREHWGVYPIFYRRAAQKAVLRMPRPLAARFQDAFRRWADDPTRRDLDVKALAGREGYPLRIGEWRALYTLDQGRMLILVLDIGPRGDSHQ